MFKFVSDNVGGIGTKRKLAQKPCESCKKRHKRCPHVKPDSSTPTPSPSTNGRDVRAVEPVVPDSPSSGTSIIVEPRPPSSQTRLASALENNPPPPDSRDPPSDGVFLRFVGDLRPEASFLTYGNRDGKRRGDIGVWLGQKPDDQTAGDGDGDGFVTVEPNGRPSFRLAGLAGLEALHPYMRRECASVLPVDYARFETVYFAKFDPLFPILHGEKLSEHDFMDYTVLKQCVCLMAALDPSLRPHLKLPHVHGLLSQAEFRASVAAAVKQSLDTGFVRDRMVVLQATVLMALYTDGTTETSEVSTTYCAQAVCQCQTMGLHLGWLKDGNSTARSRRVFWCIWVLDRLNAATNGRPIVIHDQDIDDRVWEAVVEQTPAFRLFIQLSRLFDEAIALYRPRAVPQPPKLPPAFEDLVCEAKAVDVATPLLVTLELFYLAVVIMQSGPERADPKGERTTGPGFQVHAASLIVELATGEYKSSMTFWAVLPFTVSIACSVAYKNLRNSSVTYKRKQAYTLFHSTCDILDDLSKPFPSAQYMTKLARETLKEVERVSTSRNKGKPAEGRQAPAESASGTADAPPRGTQQPGSTVSTSQMETPASRGPQFMEPYVYGDPAALGTLDPGILTGMDFADVGGIFDDFDPNFQLNRVDAVFSANLNPAMPLFPMDWMEEGPSLQ
ncbi:hypothetical protein F5X68DRAFT_147677 [Plectosphaerella plurivora]|uniref:Xylanolytic transcriptional activator regulatory domain-containing protein n=1 Tax=Plectosphaerella plurivora TaxID=936078 RepID=A0A9P8VNA0_9PEZI|nr:hypothetical protein F5X68DRAFT_147677 [Plectosphaerella plurivora]